MLRIRSNMGFFGTKGLTTRNSIIRSGRISNSLDILCLSRLSAVQIKIRLKLNRLCFVQCQIWCFSALSGKYLRSEESDLVGILTRSRCYSCPGYLQVWSWFNQKSRHYPPDNIFSIISLLDFFFIAQGRVTPKWIFRSGLKLNSSDMLWLSLLPASLTKIQSKIKSLSSGQHFPHYKSMGISVAVETKVLIQSVPEPYAFFLPPKWCYK